MHDFPYNSAEEMYPLLTIKAVKEDFFENLTGGIRMTFSNGQVNFEGNVKNGLKHGDGYEFYQNGNIRYKGRYLKNGYDGKNVVIYNSHLSEDNVMFEGDFSNGLLNGEINFLWFRDNVKQIFSYALLWNAFYINGLLQSNDDHKKLNRKINQGNACMDFKYEGYFDKGKKDDYGEIFCFETSKC